ncbi:hypothetical protein PRK78_003281 [Emydomyces testavorans]|uniref:SGNH hydrolase-type esterase domain-containing protein n=1 Tax=Emydomyces testavorans TaxID=2070801 RepID=A0AAF0DGM0_9EURO|nr:hypothetical protein PRK78_003281 [Emydomyces testavorans]
MLRWFTAGALVSSMLPTFDQFIIFGDSITQQASAQESGFAFQPALQNACLCGSRFLWCDRELKLGPKRAEYIRRLDVVNRGFRISGYTSPKGLVALGQFFPPASRDKTVFFGANDAVLPPYNQHVPLDKYRQSLKDIVTHEAVRAQGTKVLLLTPPPVNEYQLSSLDREKGFDSPSRTAKNTKVYADACREVGNSLSIPVVDIWFAFMREAGWKEGEPLAGSKDVPANEKLAALLSDGLHLSPAGYKVMHGEVMKVIRASYPDDAPEKLPVLFPPFEEAPGLKADGQ